MGDQISIAFNVLKEAMREDSAYAWSWHCNIAMMCQDAGATHEVANDGAARFMKLCFDVDTSQGPGKRKTSDLPDEGPDVLVFEEPKINLAMGQG